MNKAVSTFPIPLFFTIALLILGLCHISWQQARLSKQFQTVRKLQALYKGYIKAAEKITQLHMALREANALQRSSAIIPTPEKEEEPLHATQAAHGTPVVTRERPQPTIKTKQTQKTPLTDISFCKPLKKNQYWLSSYFGPRKKPNGQWGFHNGVDMAAHRGTPIVCIADGVIEKAEPSGGYGNLVAVHHDDVYTSWYAHLDSIAVTVGTKVNQGDILGAVGDTGHTRKTGKDASHLHLELYESGERVNPMHYINLK